MFSIMGRSENNNDNNNTSSESSDKIRADQAAPARWELMKILRSREPGPEPKAKYAEVGLFHPQVIIGTLILTGSILLSYKFYSNNLRRFATANEIPITHFRKRFIFGRVTSVGDGDNFHFYHLPGGKIGGWGWLRQLPAINNFKQNKNQTLHIRLCGVDAPERSHFGKPAQIFSEESLQWLRGYLLGRKVWIKPLSIDQYNRVVAKVMIWKWFKYQDVTAQMIKNGIGVVYEGNANIAEFDGGKKYYESLETLAKLKKRGLWAHNNSLTPGEYKKLYK